jgi:hypothetical protein
MHAVQHRTARRPHVAICYARESCNFAMQALSCAPAVGTPPPLPSRTLSTRAPGRPSSNAALPLQREQQRGASGHQIKPGLLVFSDTFLKPRRKRVRLARHHGCPGAHLAPFEARVRRVGICRRNRTREPKTYLNNKPPHHRPRFDAGLKRPNTPPRSSQFCDAEFVLPCP